MTEDEFRNRWQEEKSQYLMWGNFVASKIQDELSSQGKILSEFLKIPNTVRLKSDQSLIDKAFYRKKSYDDPYNEIEDKVGIRFVVLLIDDIRTISDIIEGMSDWEIDPCKHFDEDKENEPLLFTYQSVHYVVKPKSPLSYEDKDIAAGTPCEIQIRTLLQHAHSELTHDAIYKSKKAIKSSVQRTVAKSMALIETTDDFFSQATRALNNGPLEEFKIVHRLDALYHSFTENTAHQQKSAIIIWDEYESFLTEELVDNVTRQLVNNEKYKFLSEIIKRKYPISVLYQQSVILFLYWMLLFRKRQLLNDWPFDVEILAPLADDLGISIYYD